MQHQSNNNARLIRMKQVQSMTGLSRSCLYSLATAPGNKFPKSISLVPGGSSRAFLESEIQDWIDQRIEARDQEV
jgi:prophage regulatory protein